MTAPVPTNAPVKVFVAERGNAFMRDLADTIAEAAAAHRPTRVVVDELPAVDGSINLVVAPHEFFELHDAPAPSLRAAAAASVCIGTEQPGTPWFRLTEDACRRGLFALDINDVAVSALRAGGIDARRLHLGAVESMRISDRIERRTDVVFLGGLDDRRGRLLAELAPTLVAWRSDLRLFRFDRPVGPATPGMVFGHDKHRVLAGSRVLLNLHRAPSGGAAHPVLPYFEWVRMIEAMANGCVVVTEPAAGHDPLVDGVHFVAADEDGIADALEAVLRDERRRSEIAEAAAAMVLDALSLTETMGVLLADLDHHVLPRLAEHVRADRHRAGRWGFHGETADPVRRLGPMRPYAGVQRAAKLIALADTRALQRIDSLRCLLRHGSREHVERRWTPAYESVDPAAIEVSAVVTLYDYAPVVVETLDSLAASTDCTFEVIVVDDHSTDDGRTVVEQFADAHPDVPLLLLGKEANQGLAAARNTGFAHARAPMVMVMDADNHVYPQALARLRDTLLAHPDAAATYSILEDFGEQRNVRSALAWDPVRLCEANYVDAQAMWRTEAWWDLGGYRSDEDLVYGWEDWDLWLRLADRGGYAVAHREILGRYRVRLGSMISLTNLATDEAIEAIRGRYPGLPWPPDRGG